MLIKFKATGRELEVLQRDACNMLAYGRFLNPPDLNR